MTETETDPDMLSTTALRTMREYFTQQGHSPSAGHWAALADITDTMEAMADGTAAPSIFLSAVDPGVGKSQAVLHFARALLEDSTRRETGLLVCVGRIAEAVALAETLAKMLTASPKIPRKSFAVLTSDAEANSMGSDTPQAAQVLITTQQRLDRCCDGGTFGAASAFWFNGKPRAVRAWDEAWLPGVAITLTAVDVYSLLKRTSRRAPKLAAALMAFADDLRTRREGALIDVPDFSNGFDVPIFDVMEKAGFAQDDLAAANALRMISGRTGRVTIDNRTGSTVLSYRDTLPSDLAPLLVLDASARVRDVYRFVETHRGGVTWLKQAVKSYAPLSLNLWKTSGSKTGFERGGDALITGIVKTIESHPDEKWLIVAHKSNGRIPDVAARVQRALPKSVRGNVQTITWGQHMATNEYADASRVILAGTLFFREPFYLALTQLAQDRDVATGFASKSDVAMTTAGEHSNLILQAICRGRARKSDGDKCQPMSAYIIASPKSGIAPLLPGIFPGCSMQAWNPVQRTPRGRKAAALAAIKATLHEIDCPWVSYRQIAEKIDVSWANFRQEVVRGAEWLAHLQAAGLEESVDRIGNRRANGVRRQGDGPMIKDAHLSIPKSHHGEALPNLVKADLHRLRQSSFQISPLTPS